MSTLKNTMDVERMLRAEKTLAKITFLSYGEEPIFVVKLRLKFWYRLWAVLWSDYREKMQGHFERILEGRLIDGVKIDIVVEV